MMDDSFWDKLADSGGGPVMTHNQAKRILREQKTYCIVWQGREDVVCTGGARDIHPLLHDLALKVHFGYEPALPEPYTQATRPRAKGYRRSKV